MSLISSENVAFQTVPFRTILLDSTYFTIVPIETAPVFETLMFIVALRFELSETVMTAAPSETEVI
jgi:hypothetical protein